MKYLFALICFSVNAQNTEREDDKNKLIYLNSLYLQSYIRSDTATFNKLLWAEDFTQTNPDGTVLSRKDNALRFGKPRFDKIVYFYGDQLRLKFLKEDLAELYVRNPSAFMVDGKVEKSVSWYKDTYKKTNGQWKCISAVIKNAPF